MNNFGLLSLSNRSVGSSIRYVSETDSTSAVSQLGFRHRDTLIRNISYQAGSHISLASVSSREARSDFTQDSGSDDDTTVTTCDSSSDEDSDDEHSTHPAQSHHNAYHNPMYLGNMLYYYPVRHRQDIASSAVTNQAESDIDQEIDTSTAASTTIEAADTSTLQDIQAPDSTSTRYHQASMDTYFDNFQSSTNALNANEAWGDGIDIKCTNSFRIYFQNVNSLGLSQGPGKWKSMLASMEQMQCDFINMAQTSLNWKFLFIRERLRKHLAKRMPIHKVNIGRNRFSSENHTLPGGTAQVINGDWTGRIVEYIHDPRQLGRWCGVKIRLKHGRHLYIITAYRVCAQSTTQIGVETAYNQQYHLLSMEGIDHPDPRKVFIEDLTECIKKWQSPLDDVLVLMDANERLGSSSHGLTKLMRECKLVDLFHHHHGVCPEFATFDLGQNRLDYAIGSHSLLPYIVKCGYLAFYHGISSDHRGLFIDLSMELIDGLTKLESVPKRYLHSSFQSDVYAYKQYVHKEFLTHNIPQRALALFQMSGPLKYKDSQYIVTLNELDRLVLNIQLKAEKKCCKKKTKYDWSDDIHYTKIIINYWNIRRKAKTRKRNVDGVCNDIYNTLPEEYQLCITSAIGSAHENWLRSKLKLTTLMVQHKELTQKRYQDMLDNEALDRKSVV